MKIEYSKEWCMNMAKTEEGHSVDAGPVIQARLRAKPLNWEQDEDNQWSEKNPVRWGFYIVLQEDSEPPEYCAYWGESDGETCATLDEAKAWCQKTADDFIADAALVTPNVGAERTAAPNDPERGQP